jgi:hypothetical protein
MEVMIMLKETSLDRDHPLRKLFRNALAFGLEHNPIEAVEVTYYLEEQILCEFFHADNLYKIKNCEGNSVDDIADMLAESTVLLNAQSFQREFEVHKHIGDYTLFMLGMFPATLSSRRGKECVLGRLIVPEASLCDLYTLQGQRSYKIASEFTHGDLFKELSDNFTLYRNILECVRMYFEDPCMN